MDWTDVEFLDNTHLLDDIMDYEFIKKDLFIIYLCLRPTNRSLFFAVDGSLDSSRL